MILSAARYKNGLVITMIMMLDPKCYSSKNYIYLFSN